MLIDLKFFFKYIFPGAKKFAAGLGRGGKFNVNDGRILNINFLTKVRRKKIYFRILCFSIGTIVDLNKDMGQNKFLTFLQITYQGTLHRVACLIYNCKL